MPVAEAEAAAAATARSCASWAGTNGTRGGEEAARAVMDAKDGLLRIMVVGVGRGGWEVFGDSRFLFLLSFALFLVFALSICVVPVYHEPMTHMLRSMWCEVCRSSYDVSYMIVSSSGY